VDVVVVDCFVDDDNKVDYGTSNEPLILSTYYVHQAIINYVYRCIVVVITQSLPRHIQADAFDDIPWES
jgi:hypothetical protein